MRKYLAGILIILSINAISSEYVNVKTLIKINKDIPLKDSINTITTALIGKKLLIPQREQDTGSKFLTGKDKNGSVWLYAYTDKDSTKGIFSQPIRLIDLDIVSVYDLAHKQKMEGIVINTDYPIPRSLLDKFFIPHFKANKSIN